MKPRHLDWFPAAVLSVFSLSCSDAAPPPAAVGLTLGIAPPSIPQSGFQCNTSGTTKTIGDPAPIGTNPGNRIADGESSVKVDCKVSGKDTFSVSGRIEQGKDVKFTISGGTIDKATGKGTFTASLVLVGDQVFATSESGQTYIFKATPQKFKLVAENKLGDEVYATPAICGGCLYMRVVERTGEQRQEMLYCLGQSPK